MPLSTYWMFDVLTKTEVAVDLAEDIRSGLGVALNEAALLGFEVDPARRLAAATFAVHTLSADGNPPPDTRVQMLLSPVGRVAASLRNGRWDDAGAQVVPFDIDQLLGIVTGFGGLPIYGWKFFDVHDEQLGRVGRRFSLDWRAGADGVSHSITVFQEGGDARYLDLIVWFDEMELFAPDGSAISVDDFIAGGARWWDAMYAGDSRAGESGIFPLKA